MHIAREYGPAAVWRARGGTRDVAALARHCELDPIALELALDSLRSSNTCYLFPGSYHPSACHGTTEYCKVGFYCSSTSSKCVPAGR